MTHRPSSIPLPVQSGPATDSLIPPTPSAFPSLSGDSTSSTSTPALPASTLHYAQVTGKVLPPSSIPKGVSLPPPVHQPSTSTNSSSSTSRDRIQSSGQKNRDSPYARPGTGPRTTSGAQQPRERRKSKSSAARPSKPAPPSGSTQDGSASSHENKRKSIPGMPPAWVAKNSKTSPTATPKVSHTRRKSEGAPTFAMVKDKDKDKEKKEAAHPPGPGKKKRQTLGKTLAPSNSKLSALAPSFEFVPRSATTPNLSSYAQESSAGSGSEEGGNQGEESEQTQSDSPSQDPSSSSSLGSFLSSSFTLSSTDSLTSFESSECLEEEEKKDPAEGLVDEKLAAEIVSSSGPQADGFVGQSLTQSESGARPDADKTGFRAISGVVNESPLADLEWKEKMGWWREDYDPKVPSTVEEEEASTDEKQAEEDKVVLAPAAIEANSNETPLLQFPPWTPSPSDSSASSTDNVDVSESSISPAILSEVLPNSFSDSPSSDEPSTSTTSTSTAVPSQPPTSTSDEQPVEAPAAESATPSLSSFLPTSFTPPLSGYPSTSTSFDSSFLSQDELRAEKLAHDGPHEPQADSRGKPEEEEATAVAEMPLSAEAVASQPTLDDALDVERATKSEVTKEDVPEVRKGWWNEEEGNEGKDDSEKPQPGQAEHSDKMVDPQLAKETVESAGPQADGFVAKGYTEADKIGEEAQEGEKVVKKEAEREVVAKESHREVVDEPLEEERTRAGAEEERAKGTSTPLGSFLSSAFQPSDTAFSASQESTQEETPAVSKGSDSSSTPVPSTTQFRSSASTPAPPARRSSSPPPPPERRPSESHAADSAPSLTLAISSAWHTAPWSRKIWAIIASVAINVGLPFVNGVMLGFGELFARNVLGVRFGWPLHNNTATTSTRANTGGVGLRSAGAYNKSNSNGGRGVGTDVPGHAGAKTALEGVVESVAE